MDKELEKYSIERWGKNIYQDSIDKWGEFSQFDQMIEEMAELTVALNKYKRQYNDSLLPEQKAKIMDNLLEELADVKMMLEEMEYMFGKDKIEKVYDKKIEKFFKQLYK